MKWGKFGGHYIAGHRRCSESLTRQPPFYYRYVDDILLAAPLNLLDNILEIFNYFHDRLKFTKLVGATGSAF